MATRLLKGLGIASVAGAGVAYGVMRAGQPRPTIYPMHGKTVVVTGANSGIGKETAVALAAGGARVIVGARSPQRGSAAVDEIRARTGSDDVELAIGDLASLESVRAFAAEIAERAERLDVLINNAGLILSERTETVDGFESTFAINHLGPFLLTNLLLPTIEAAGPGARIVNVASIAHLRGQLDLDDLMFTQRPYDTMTVYGTSKLCNILFTRELAGRLDPTVVTANCLHPGTIRSGFGQDGDVSPLFTAAMKVGRPLFVDEERGASTTVYLAGDPAIAGITGEYFSRRRRRTPSPQARDDLLARGLWERSAELVGLDA